MIDPDGDGQPGVTYELFASTRSLRLEYYAGVVRSHPVRGTIDPRGAHAAQWELDEVAYRLGCSIDSGCTTGSGVDVPCASNANPVAFVPLREPPLGQSEWTCAALRGSQTRLFPRTPTAPSRCQSVPATDQSIESALVRGAAP